MHFRFNEILLGQYWIDPNEGDTKDAILVHCDMEKKASCILPKPDKSPTISYKGRGPEIWLGDIQGGMKVCSESLLCKTQFYGIVT